MMDDRRYEPGSCTPCSPLAAPLSCQRTREKWHSVMSLSEEGHARKREERENEWTQQQHGCSQQWSTVSSLQLGTSKSFLKHPRHFPASRVSNPFFKLSTPLKLGALSLCFERVSAVLISATFSTPQVWDPHRTKLQIKLKNIRKEKVDSTRVLTSQMWLAGRESLLGK